MPFRTTVPQSSVSLMILLFQYELLRRSAFSNILYNGNTYKALGRILESEPLFFAAGNLIWGYVLKFSGKAAIIAWISLALTAAGFFVPKTPLAHFLFKRRAGEKYVHNLRFSEAKEKYYSCQTVLFPSFYFHSSLVTDLQAC